MQRKSCTAIPQFVLKDRSNQELLDGAKHLVGRHRTVTAHLIAHLAEIYMRKLDVIEGFSNLPNYCMGVLGLSEDEAYRRAHAAVLAKQYPVILDMLLEGSIHLSTLREIGKHLTPANHEQVLKASQYKNKRELEHLVAALFPKSDVPTVFRKLPEPRPEIGHAGSEESLFVGGNEKEVVLGGTPEEQAESAVSVDIAGIMATPLLTSANLPVPPSRPKSRLAPLSPHRYNLQVTVDEETYNALKQLQDLLRHQVRNGDLARIIKDSVLERLEGVKREKFGYTKRPRKAREQESWIEVEKPVAEVSATEKEPIAPGGFEANSRHIPNVVKREVWERDKGQCAFVSRNGRQCSEKGRLEFHHIHAYALGGPATVENIALRCRAHNAHEGVALFGQKVFRPRANADSIRPRGKAKSGVFNHPGEDGGSVRSVANGDATHP